MYMPIDIVQAKLKEIKKRYNINNVFFSTKWYGDSYYYSGKYVLFNGQRKGSRKTTQIKTALEIQ